MENKITIVNIRNSIEKVEIADGDKESIINELSKAREHLDSAYSGINNLSVKGKEAMDVLLGCILAIEQIIGT